MVERADLTVPELRLALTRVLDAVEEQHGPELRFPVDYYWLYSVEQAFDLERSDVEVLCGQVSDDVESVRRFARQPTDEWITVCHELEHLRGVFLAIEHLELTGPWLRDPLRDGAGE